MSEKGTRDQAATHHRIPLCFVALVPSEHLRRVRGGISHAERSRNVAFIELFEAVVAEFLLEQDAEDAGAQVRILLARSPALNSVSSLRAEEIGEQGSRV